MGIVSSAGTPDISNPATEHQNHCLTNAIAPERALFGRFFSFPKFKLEEYFSFPLSLT
jgi:hypothetical protein